MPRKAPTKKARPARKKKRPVKKGAASSNQPKGRTGQRKLGGDKTAVVDLTKARKRFLQIYADPQDVRDEQDIAEELGVHPAQLVEWRLQPSFYEPGTQMFDQALRSSRVPLVKTLLQQAFQRKSQGAINKVLEMLGMIEGKGTKINIMNVGANGGSQSDSHLGKLTDSELDDEIALRLHATTKGDVVLQDGAVVPYEDFVDVDYKELDCLDHGTTRPRVDTKGS